MLQHRGNQSQLFANKVRSITNAKIERKLKTRKLKTALPSLKSSLSRDLKPNVVYKLSCCGCKSTSVGQIVRHLATRVEEHKKEDSLVGIHICQRREEATTAQLNREIIDHSNNSMELLTMEALHIRKLRPGINTRVEFRSREFSLKL